MARCEDIKLLLGPFEDGELEPHEMQEVARHVVGCAACDGELADYRTLAVSLRDAGAMPDVNGFSAAVVARVAELFIPFGLRLRRYVTSFADGIGATLATGFAAAAVAVVTAVILTPYFKQAQFTPNSRRPAEIARTAPSTAAVGLGAVARNNVSPAIPDDDDHGLFSASGGGDIAPVIHLSEISGNSGAIIDRLEADSPSIAVWSEPQSDTTVIWVPDQLR